MMDSLIWQWKADHIPSGNIMDPRLAMLQNTEHIHIMAIMNGQAVTAATFNKNETHDSDIESYLQLVFDGGKFCSHHLVNADKPVIHLPYAQKDELSQAYAFATAHEEDELEALFSEKRNSWAVFPTVKAGNTFLIESPTYQWHWFHLLERIWRRYYGERNVIIIDRIGQTCSLFIGCNQKVLFYNQFNCPQDKDLLYYLLFVIDGFELEGQDFLLAPWGEFLDREQDIKQLMASYFDQIKMGMSPETGLTNLFSSLAFNIAEF